MWQLFIEFIKITKKEGVSKQAHPLFYLVVSFDINRVGLRHDFPKR